MRYRKFHLGLPNDHCWVHEVWLEFEKLSKTKLVEGFWLDLEEVLFLFPTEEKYQEMQEAPQASDSRLQQFIMSLNPGMLNAQLYHRMFQQLWRAGRI